MRQVWISGTGGPEKLELREAPDPAPTAGTLRVRVRASGINFADILARQGLYPDAPKIPCVVGYEVSGTVDAVGDGVDAMWIGKDVFGLTRFGGYADVVIAPVEQMFEKPAVLTHEQAAAIPVLLRGARNEERGVLEVHERRETQRCAKAAPALRVAARIASCGVARRSFGTTKLPPRALPDAILTRNADVQLIQRLPSHTTRRCRPERAAWRSAQVRL